jgi:hypothetical protein
MERLANEYRLNSRTKSPFMTEKQVEKCPQVLGDRIPPSFVKKIFPVFFFFFGIFVINLCYIIREISLFHRGDPIPEYLWTFFGTFISGARRHRVSVLTMLPFHFLSHFK